MLYQVLNDQFGICATFKTATAAILHAKQLVEQYKEDNEGFYVVELKVIYSEGIPDVS